jgi:V/A-type H+-transporting ATPase subunit A
MNEMVEVGDERLVGEVIDLDEDLATIQVYEDTTGLRPGADVYAKGLPLYVELGPGLIGEIFDGVQRPLEILRGKWGDFIRRGKTGTALPRDRVWQFTPSHSSLHTGFWFLLVYRGLWNMSCPKGTIPLMMSLQ